MRHAIILLLVLACLTAACRPAGREEPGRPTRLTVCLAKPPLTLDPRYNIDAASHRLTQVMFNGLVRKGPNMTPLPDLAESWRLEDKLTWIFKLRQGVKFHNGAPLTSEDVAYTFRSILDPASKSPKRHAYQVIESIETPDEHTVIIRTAEPFAPLLVNMNLGIVPAEAARRTGEDFAAAPVGTGPFRFVKADADGRVELAAFDEHFRGRPKMRGLVFRVIPDDTTRYLELIKGNIDFAQNAIIPDMVPVVENKPGFQVIKTPGTNYEYLAFNLQDPYLSDIRVRAAIAHALNVPEMIASMFSGRAEPATGLLPPGHWAYEPDVRRYDYNPDLARILLDQAGRPVGEDGYRFELTYKTSLGDQAKIKAEIIQQALADIGIKVHLRGYDWGTLFADINAGDFQMYSLQWVGISEPDIYHMVFHSESTPPDGANRGRYSNPRMDELIEAGRRTMDREERKRIYSEIQKIAARDLPYVSLWYPTNVVIMKKGLTGFTPYPDGDLSGLWRIRWREKEE